MLGKGTKRKLDEDEDGPVEEALVRGAREEEDPPSKLSYSLQRQTVLSLSLMKLYHPRTLTEPSLERRLLVSNVLRRIQDELKQEGGPQALFFHPPSPPSHHDPLGEGFQEAQPAFGVPSPVAAVALPSSSGLVAAPTDSCLTPASLLEDDAPLLCTSPVPGVPLRPPALPAKDSFSSALDEIEELCSAQGSSGTSPSCSTGLPSKNGTRPCSQKLGASVDPLTAATPGEPRPMDTQPSSGLEGGSSSSSGFLTDLALDDVLFADIDTSMYDFDPYTSSSGGGTAKMAPVVTADDLLKSLSPFAGAGGTPVGPSQPFKMDLAELDHIMEVLVGS